jgi:hypothetical protein
MEVNVMKNDKEIRSTVMKIKESVDEFAEYTETLNQCAYTDSMVLNIIDLAEKLKAAYDSNIP